MMLPYFRCRHGVGFTDNLGWGQDAYVGGFSLNQIGNLTRIYRDKDVLCCNSSTTSGTYSTAPRLARISACVCLWTAHAFTYPCPGGKVPLTETENLPLPGPHQSLSVLGVGCAVIVLLIIGLSDVVLRTAATSSPTHV
ncbi:hypothetical protein BV898_18906 [Hypsibius exemplaris]|uniref:Uncharacterized protein n=1 Tax=Hypsibius exemplaris TaxID=2072580 RepID=A0A9X6NPU5_HYPEX|nr:hypothetical protein BV898_18906 [Hypsibius exemplaris]